MKRLLRFAKVWLSDFKPMSIFQAISHLYWISTPVFSAYNNKVRCFKIHTLKPIYSLLQSLSSVLHLKHQPELSMRATVDWVTTSLKWDDKARHGSIKLRKHRLEICLYTSSAKNLTQAEPQTLDSSGLHSFLVQDVSPHCHGACTATGRVPD